MVQIDGYSNLVFAELHATLTAVFVVHKELRLGRSCENL